jgi:hypothetical protein
MTAALVLFMAVVGLVGTRGWMLSPPGDAGSAVLPAIDDTTTTGQAAATPNARTFSAESSLLDVTLPSALLGRQSGAIVPGITWIYQRYGIDPGQQVIYPAACAAPDFVVRYVLQGSYTAKALGLMEILRHDAASDAPESVPPGQEVVLHAGDALLYHNTMGDEFAGFRNAGAEEVELLDWQWLEDDCRDTVPVGMNLRWDAFPGSDVDALPLPVDTSRPLRIQFRVLDVPPGAMVPQDGPDGSGLLPPGFPGEEVAVADQGQVRVTDTAPKEAIHPVSSDTPPAGGVVSGVSYLPADSVRTVQSTGPETLRLYTLTIVNAEASASSTRDAAAQEATPMS